MAGGTTYATQHENFTTCIRNNVNEYGGASVCLRGMLVNADDAGASEFCVCLDDFKYRSDHLLSETMISLQGRAIVVGNNAEFIEADWEGYIKNIGGSLKLHKPDTAGKFGKGALTAYSFTDVV